jgi:cation transport protein ChaC
MTKLTRESIERGDFRAWLTKPGIPYRLLPDEEILASLDRTLAAEPPEGDVWLFAYGSLIWNPTFHFVGKAPAMLHGWHRRFCLWTQLGRGTLDRPGLLLGLDRGGSCHGVAFRIAGAAARTELAMVWRREMIGGSYIPRWVTTRLDDCTVRAVTFTINHAHPNYAGHLPDDKVVEVLATATGALGTCAEYFLHTVEHLEELRLRDRHLRRLRDRVLARRAHETAVAHSSP